MQMISSRAVAFLDAQSLAPGHAWEALFRDGEGSFLVYLSDGDPWSATEERVNFFGSREAVIWRRERPQDQGILPGMSATGNGIFACLFMLWQIVPPSQPVFVRRLSANMT